MRLNIYILFDKLKDFSPQINTSRDIDLTLRQIRFPEFPDDNLQQDCIYLLEASSIEEHARMLQGIDLISIGPIDMQNETFSNLSVIILPEDCSKTAIFNKVQDIFEKYEQWDYSLMRSIATNDSLQTVANQAASTLKNPFALLDISLKKILIGGPMPAKYDGTIWELVLEKGYTPNETFSPPADDLCFFLRHNNRPYFAYDTPYKQNSHLMVNLFLDNKLFALLCTSDINASFTQGQISLVQHVRDVMELAIASSTELNGSPEIVIYYLEELLKGFPADEKIIRYHLEKRGWSICDRFRIYTVANLNEEELSTEQANFYIFRIKKLQEDAITFSYENSIVIITRQRQSKSNADIKYQKALADLLSKLGLHCGCSYIFDHFRDLKYYYIQSKAALQEGEKSNPENILWHFDHYYFQHMISSLNNSTSLKSICHPNILRLREHDDRYGTDFVKCLRVYLFNGCNIAQTGKALFMHRNTLTYRLGKIAEIIGTDVHQLHENERMQLWFSCLLCDYL